jgi:Fur family peroxide stress response transcriptional regulator
MNSLIEKKYRRSSQRDQILAHLHTRYDHPTAMGIYQGLKPSIPTLSLGNLYRNLGILLEQGKIIKVRDGEGNEDRFDGHVHTHFHFYCTTCHQLFDLPADRYPDLKAAIDAEGSWKVNSMDISLSGLCPDCATLIDK